MRVAVLSLLLATLFVALPVQAAESTFFGPIVPTECQSCPCGFAGVLEIMRHLMNFAVTFGVIVLTIMLAWGGLTYILSATNPESRNKANQMLTGAVIGMVLVLSSWLIVDFVMRTLYSGPTGTEGKFGPWNSILAEDAEWCIVAKETKPIFSFIPIASAPPVSPTNPAPNPNQTGTDGCPNCVSLSELGLECKDGCTIDPRVAPKLVQLKENFRGSWRVTEAYPPSRSHANVCHKQGTCVDAGFKVPTSYSVSNVTSFASAARSAGLRPVFETTDCSLRDAVRKAGLSAYCRADGGGYEGITGNHFSLYGI